MEELPDVVAQFNEHHDDFKAPHKGISYALETLLNLAGKAGNTEIVTLAMAMRSHETMEDKDVYPKATLMANYIKSNTPVDEFSEH